MTVALAPVACFASLTVLKTGRPAAAQGAVSQAVAPLQLRFSAPRWVLPPFLGVTPPTSLVPYAMAWRAIRLGQRPESGGCSWRRAARRACSLWKVPFLPVKPWQMTCLQHGGRAVSGAQAAAR